MTQLVEKFPSVLFLISEILFSSMLSKTCLFAFSILSQIGLNIAGTLVSNVIFSFEIFFRAFKIILTGFIRFLTKSSDPKQRNKTKKVSMKSWCIYSSYSF
jgi:hypothetical protein